ncbi:MAG: UDP-N-acetylmuramoyl-L-alanyl-D-glutamate--2,6-diaminopimelate ligase [Ferrovibrio sp.]|uniref:UDP-N-acetylmuramoyl-L-alanyl-D-glutamate--2, 6-diaminopimelate ligase n=1 Tax=Ferrovibrio sp. TaxID=1917215 RepID=UPI002612D401|nr:UDP-N-acetylmuramoyl-L-alanyl-D-glutamate--2,6-diaminopimelate ligase [Ferrovibrio sp.]MCW0233301.1 UDP-N-acetylmuramoyl-L-alanyl-D-glutamate--2,6-diaminopimelate ligase [Ferrovibrio sp.]
MRLSDLCADLPLDPRAAALDVAGLTADSRAVRPGYVFAALKGTQADGHRFIPDAREKGAVAVLSDHVDPAYAGQIAFVTDTNPRRRLALMAAAFFGAQPNHIAAVTGTNGKTSVTNFTAQIWARLGFKSASLGTLGLHTLGLQGADLDLPVAHTTPDPVQLHELLTRAKQAGAEHLALEASSHGLDQFRLDGIVPQAAAFTNLTRDHMDYHPTVEAYFAAKLRLFDTLLPADGAAVINMDSALGAKVEQICTRRGQRLIRYGQLGTELKLLSAVPHAGGLQVEAEVFGVRRHVDLPLIGGFQAGNVLAALGLVVGCGVHAAAAWETLATLDGVPGRMQKAAQRKNGASIFVDYAHTPDALETVLKAARPHSTQRLAVVFGCGGDRDRGKRPLMGAVATKLADRVYVTDDNPRSEEAASIRAAIMAAAPGAREIGDRREAVFTAVAELQPGDLLLVAGKGHEQGQVIGKDVRPFDDLLVAREAVSAADAGSGLGSAPYGGKG